MSDLASLFTVIAIALMAVGVLGSIVPRFPGLLITAGSAIVYGLVSKFETVTIGYLATVASIVMLLYLTETTVAHRSDTHRSGISGGVFGALVGAAGASVAHTTLAYLCFPLLGALAGFAITGRDIAVTLRFGSHAIVAFVGVTILKLVSGGWMVYSFWQRVMQ